MTTGYCCSLIIIRAIICRLGQSTTHLLKQTTDHTHEQLKQHKWLACSQANHTTHHSGATTTGLFAHMPGLASAFSHVDTTKCARLCTGFAHTRSADATATRGTQETAASSDIQQKSISSELDQIMLSSCAFVETSL